jgi:predicted TIM-barrel fold metal-dependent hydrolase
MVIVDAHVHVWTDDTAHYPLGPGRKKEDRKPARFTPEDLFEHTKPAGVERVVLIQMSHYVPKDKGNHDPDAYDNRYMLDMIALYPKVFAGTAVIDPHSKDVADRMKALAKKRVRAFRIYPALSTKRIDKWLEPTGFATMFEAGAKNDQAMACLIRPDALPELDRMCKKYPETPVIVDHLCRLNTDEGAAKDIDAFCALAKHPRVLVKVGGFQVLGAKKPPYTDLAPLIEKVVKAFGPKRCMWESNYPIEKDDHPYQGLLDLVKKRLDFLDDDARSWILGKTADSFFFKE